MPGKKMNQLKSQENKIERINKKEELFRECFERYDEKFSLKKKPIYKNRKRVQVQLKKEKLNKLFQQWAQMPYSLVLYTLNPRIFHNMSSYFYAFKEFLIFKKYRKIDATIDLRFDCYRVYDNNLLKLYDNIEEILNYDIYILGIEIKGQLYPIEKIAKFLQTIKEDLNFFFNTLTEINNVFNNILSNYGNIDMGYNQYLQEIFLICQHIIKSDGGKEQ